MGLKLLLFTTARCKPCEVIKPIIQKLVEEYGLSYEEIDVDRNSELPRLYEVTSVPTVVFLRGNEVVDRISNVKTESPLRTIIVKRLKEEWVGDLLFPPYILLLRFADILAKESENKRVRFASYEEFKEAVKKAVIEYCREAYEVGGLPIYTFKYAWESPELDSDLETLPEDLKIAPTERARTLMNGYRKILDSYDERIRRAVNKVLSKAGREKVEEATNPL
jgi:thioredoxin-like negative regulator of GroEL